MEVYQRIKARFPYLDDEKLAEMLSLGELVSLKEGEIFIEAGSNSRRTAFVVEGLMRNYFTNEKGEEITVVFSSEMQPIMPYAPLFLNKPATETTQAIEPSLLLVFDAETFIRRADIEHAYARAFSDMLQRAFIDAVTRIEDFTHKNPTERYLRLIEMPGDLINRVPLKYLASYLGITTFSLSRIRKRLSKNRN